MHWLVGKRRVQHRSAVAAARATARATRLAAATGLVGTLLTVGVAVAAEIATEDVPQVRICTAVAIMDYNYLYELGEITHEEYVELRGDAISDQITDAGDC